MTEQKCELNIKKYLFLIIMATNSNTRHVAYVKSVNWQMPDYPLKDN